MFSSLGIKAPTPLPMSKRGTWRMTRTTLNSKEKKTIAAAAAAASPSSSPPVSLSFVKTSDGACDLEVLESFASSSSSSKTDNGNSERPPLLFVHGSGHAAWAWADKLMPYASAGRREGGLLFDCAAVSLRGRGKSGPPPKGSKAGGTLQSHAEDVASVAKKLVEAGKRPPIVVGHSFGGLVVQVLALREKERLLASSSTTTSSPSSSPSPLLSGIALLNSVPPSGNASMIGRIAKQRGLWTSAKLTYGFIARAYAKDPALCRLMFFSDELDESEVERYVRLLRENDGETPVLDVRELPKHVPLPPLISRQAEGKEDGKELLWPWFVLGGSDDTIVDAEACRECAEWLGGGIDSSSNNLKVFASRSVTIEGLAHDSMLDARWREAADALLDWAETV